MIYKEQMIPREPSRYHYFSEAAPKEDMFEVSKTEIKPKKSKRITSSSAPRVIILNSQQEAEDMSKARILVRSVIHSRIITEDHQWAKRTVEQRAAPYREQIYQWTSQGHKRAYEWLETKGIEEPDILPTKRNTKELSKEVTAVWLMYVVNGINLHETLESNMFTIPLIALELTKLKY